MPPSPLPFGDGLRRKSKRKIDKVRRSEEGCCLAWSRRVVTKPAAAAAAEEANEAAKKKKETSGKKRTKEKASFDGRGVGAGNKGELGTERSTGKAGSFFRKRSGRNLGREERGGVVLLGRKKKNLFFFSLYFFFPSLGSSDHEIFFPLLRA